MLKIIKTYLTLGRNWFKEKEEKKDSLKEAQNKFSEEVRMQFLELKKKGLAIPVFTL